VRKIRRRTREEQKKIREISGKTVIALNISLGKPEDDFDLAFIGTFLLSQQIEVETDEGIKKIKLEDLIDWDTEMGAFIFNLDGKTLREMLSYIVPKFERFHSQETFLTLYNKGRRDLTNEIDDNARYTLSITKGLE
jgi:hypothetical protein